MHNRQPAMQPDDIRGANQFKKKGNWAKKTANKTGHSSPSCQVSEVCECLWHLEAEKQEQCHHVALKCLMMHGPSLRYGLSAIFELIFVAPTVYLVQAQGAMSFLSNKGIRQATAAALRQLSYDCHTWLSSQATGSSNDCRSAHCPSAAGAGLKKAPSYWKPARFKLPCSISNDGVWTAHSVKEHWKWVVVVCYLWVCLCHRSALQHLSLTRPIVPARCHQWC